LHRQSHTSEIPYESSGTEPQRTPSLAGDLVALAGSIVSIVAMFLPWYRVAVPLGPFGLQSGMDIMRLTGLRSGGLRYLVIFAASVATAMAISRIASKEPAARTAVTTYLVCGSVAAAAVLSGLFIRPRIPGPLMQLVGDQNLLWRPYYGLLVAMIGALDILVGALLVAVAPDTRQANPKPLGQPGDKRT
jgi:hypothetical protein